MHTCPTAVSPQAAGESTLGQLPPLLTETPQSPCHPSAQAPRNTWERQSGLREQMLGWKERERRTLTPAPGPGWGWLHWVSDPTLKCLVTTACKIAEAKILLRSAVSICLQSLQRQVWTLAWERYHPDIYPQRAAQSLQLLLDDAQLQVQHLWPPSRTDF